MKLELLHESILNSKDDAVVITVDGAARGLEGNIARQFKKRYAEEWEIIEDSFTFPIPLGRAAYVDADPPIPHKIIFAASILDHMNRAGRQQMPGVVRSALSEICETAATLQLTSIASPLLKGGWRMDAMTALKAMVDVADEFLSYQGGLKIYVLDQSEYELLKGYANTFGIEF